MYDCLALGCAEKGLCGSTQCNRWVKYLKGKKMKESAIQKKIIAYLNSVGYCVKIISANKSGKPDLICCVDGKFYAFEVKRSDGGITSDLQWINILKIRDAGGIANVVSSIEEVKEILKGNR